MAVISRNCLFLAPLLAALACEKQPLSPVDAPAGAPSDEKVLPEPPATFAEKTNAPAPAVPLLFRFGDDEAGRTLEKLLMPRPPVFVASLPLQGPIGRPLPTSLAFPEWPFSRLKPRPSLYPEPNLAAVRPAPPIESVPMELARRDLETPEKMEFSVGGLVKWPAPDVKQPAPLPILARSSADRAPLGDPTFDFSAASIINARLPLRTSVAPFVKVNLPNPFESSEAARSKIDLIEDPWSSLGSPPPPKR